MSNERGRSRPGHLSLLTVVSAAAVGGAIFLGLGHRALGADYFFDEMWRVDMAHAANIRDRYLQHDTPIPPGWLYVIGFTARLTMNSPVLLRLGQMAVGALALGVLSDAFRQELNRARVGIGRATSVAVVVATAAAVASTSVVHGVALYFNNYGFEMLGLATVLWLLARESYSRRTDAMLLLVLTLGPLFFLGPLFAWPGVAVVYLLRIRKRKASLASMAIASAIGTITVAAVYHWFYEPIAGSRSGSIQNFWEGGSVKTLGVLDDRIGTAASQFVAEGFGGWSGLSGHTIWGALFVILGLVFTAVILGRKSWWFFFIPISAFPMAVIGGLAAGWPVTPVRVNVAVIMVLHALTAFGWICGTAILVQRMLSRPIFKLVSGRNVGVARLLVIVPGAVTVVLSASVVAIGWPEGTAGNAASTAVYARGLSGDLRALKSWAGPNNVVLSYHFMSHWYAHHELVNRQPKGQTFTVVRDRFGDRSLYDDPLEQISELLSPDVQIWCVIPYETGPEDSAKACQFPPDRFEVFRRQRGVRAEIVGVKMRTPAT